MWGTTSQTRRVLPQLLRRGDIRVVKARNGVQPTHSTGDRLWEIVGAEALKAVQKAYASDVERAVPAPYLAEYPSSPGFPLHLRFPLLGPPSALHERALEKLAKKSRHSRS